MPGTFGWIVIGVVVVLVLYAIYIYNRLVRMRNEVDNAWAQIDVQLKRRHDLIPNLVETTKGYAAHERETLEKVIQARNAAMSVGAGPGAGGVAAIATAEGALTGALKSLFALSESYPDLKANQSFLSLQEELASTENRIAFARQFYNDTTLNYNTHIQTIPDVFFAGMMAMTKREYFEVRDETERAVPKVAF